MRHPFDGIIVPDATVSPSESSGGSAGLAREDDPSRRTFLRNLGALAGAVWGALLANSGRAMAQQDEPGRQRDTSEPRVQHERAEPQGNDRRHTTQAHGEDGGGATTYALGEEGGSGSRDGRYTTYALGEEGAGGGRDGRYTTYALGEEGAGGGRDGRYTTYALGEEGAGGGRDGRYTTYALGEEGAGGHDNYRRRWYSPRSYHPDRYYWGPWHEGGHRGPRSGQWY